MSTRPSQGFGSKPTPRASGGGGAPSGSRGGEGGQHVTLNEQGVATLQEKSKGGFICKMRCVSRAIQLVVVTSPRADFRATPLCSNHNL